MDLEAKKIIIIIFNTVRADEAKEERKRIKRQNGKERVKSPEDKNGGIR